MAKAKKDHKPVPNDGSVLVPVKKDLGPTLSVADGQVEISFGVRNASWPLGSGSDHAVGLVTYTTIIPEGEARGFSNLTKEGYLLTGWLLVDGEGQVLGRLANDDETVYALEDVRRFAKYAGLKVDDWGRVDHETIEKLMTTPRVAKDKQGNPRSGVTGREWLMATGIAGGMLVSWPFASQLVFESVRGRGLIIMLIGISGFAVGALGLWLGRVIARIADSLVWVIGLVIASVALAVAVYAAATEFTFWRLKPGQPVAVFAGLAMIFGVMPLWSRYHRKPSSL